MDWGQSSEKVNLCQRNSQWVEEATTKAASLLINFGGGLLEVEATLCHRQCSNTEPKVGGGRGEYIFERGWWRWGGGGVPHAVTWELRLRSRDGGPIGWR